MPPRRTGAPPATISCKHHAQGPDVVGFLGRRNELARRQQPARVAEDAQLLLAAASKTACSASKGRKAPCRTRAVDLVADLYRRMPDARITDILLEVDDATRFTEAFTHLRTGSPCRDRIGLLNVLLAEGINLGLRKMAEATTTHGFWELMRIARWHVEGEAYDRALSTVVEAQAALPMAAFWGTGRTASQRRPVLPGRRPGRSPST